MYDCILYMVLEMCDFLLIVCFLFSDVDGDVMSDGSCGVMVC